MDRIRLAADSTCDLSPDIIKEYNIKIFPLHVRMGEKEYSDGVDVTPEQIYMWSDETKQTPKTSAPAPMEAETIIEEMLLDAEEVICFTISQEMSSCFSILTNIAKMKGVSRRFHVVDSANLSTGIGLLVVDAAECIRRGMSTKDILGRIEEFKPRVRASFVVDTLVFLHRGGRCSGLAAMLGGKLRIHPSIAVDNGKMRPDKKYRGSLKKAVHDYAKDLEPRIKAAVPDRVFITHSGVDREIVEEVRMYLKSFNKFDEILETRAGCVVSSHCGPGTLGILFISMTD